ncbi:nSTAND1 domain-containing NTPase [Plantactinospora soyae]|uniref:nSTAND1 domain-containing NTPase n=1 Tax=Plantactinospora soyae TaxID=1544732 RepID=UPI00384BC8BB
MGVALARGGTPERGTGRGSGYGERAREVAVSGLAAFQPQDAEVFFGRAVLVGELVRRLRERRFLAVFDPSGAGKSSLVRAGLVPAMGRPAVVLTPGAHPMAELAAHRPARRCAGRWAARRAAAGSGAGASHGSAGSARHTPGW